MTNQATDNPFLTALDLIIKADAVLLETASLSIAISLGALVIASIIGIPVGATLALGRFRGRGTLSALINGFMGLPPVVVGLVVYLALSRAGPFGVLQLLFTPTAMIIAQVILITPIITAYSRDAIARHNDQLADLFISLHVPLGKRVVTLITEARTELTTGLLAGFGRGIAEVGAVMIVGGNIEHYTRTMTTAIVLETSKGNLDLAVALGMVLISLTVLVALLAQRLSGERRKAWL